jgi:uncharacterized protein YfeS
MTGLFIFVSCNGKTNNKSKKDTSKNTQMENYELSPETGHPKAKKLLTEDFYWSPIDETGPFGSDDGSDAFYGFRQWRLTNKTESPVTFLNDLIKSWGYPHFDLNEMTESKISEYITAKTQVDNSGLNDQMPAMMEQFKKMAKDAGKEFDEKQFKEMMATTSSSMGGSFLLGQDNAVIAIGFGQFVLEGIIDEDIKSLTKIAIKRELLPVLIDRWGEYKKTRTEQLNKMLTVVDKMNE